MLPTESEGTWSEQPSRRFCTSPTAPLTVGHCRNNTSCAAGADDKIVDANTCFFATVNCAIDGSGTTSAVVAPDGTLIAYQPYGKRGLLIADVNLADATGLLASRCKSHETQATDSSGD